MVWWFKLLLMCVILLCLCIMERQQTGDSNTQKYSSLNDFSSTLSFWYKCSSLCTDNLVWSMKYVWIYKSKYPLNVSVMYRLMHTNCMKLSHLSQECFNGNLVLPEITLTKNTSRLMYVTFDFIIQFDTGFRATFGSSVYLLT